MSKFVNKKPNICLTAGGILIYQDKVLLIKHKKLNMWLSPGGHVDAGELPHQAAEREFFEETGVKVKVVEPFVTLPNKQSSSQFQSRYLPSPILTNLHWVCKQNYRARVLGRGKPDPNWPRGCEQHLGFTYLVKLISEVDPPVLKFNQKETTQIGWFSLPDLKTLANLNDEIKWEVQLAFRIQTKTSKIKA